MKNFKTGIEYIALRDDTELDYGWVDTSIGPVSYLLRTSFLNVFVVTYEQLQKFFWTCYI